MSHFDVVLHGRIVGQIEEAEGRTPARFRFLDEYRRMPRRPVLGQYFEDDLERVYEGKRTALPPWFANLVPEGALRELLARSLGVSPDHDLEMLAAVGRDLPGAVEIVPASADRGLFANYAPPPRERSGPEASQLSLRFSLPGVQMKFSVLRDQEKVTLPVRGELGDWIIKMDSDRFPELVRNEFATMEWARAAGFRVPECRVIPPDALDEGLRPYADGREVFLIRRYDRAGDRRIHQEDLAQVVNLPPRHKYDQVTYEACGRIIRGIAGWDGYAEFVRRLVFMIVSGNTDAHLKNWSLLYPDSIRAELAPLYDQVATLAWPVRVTFEWSLKLAGTKNPLHTDRARMALFAERAGESPKQTMKIVDETLTAVLEAWKAPGVADRFPPEHAAAIRAYWKRAPLLTSRI